MALDFSSLQKAVGLLDAAVALSIQAPDDDIVQSATIQRFEYTFELCWKMIKRQLESEVPTPAEVDQWSFNQLMREASERGLVESVEKWMTYRSQRNLTSHTYDGEKAEQVHETAQQFVKDAKELLLALQSRQRD